MDLGEKLQTLKNMIYNYAKAELARAEAPLSLQSIVMDAVAAEFKNESYNELVYKNLQLFEKLSEQEPHTGNPKDLLDALKEEENSEK